MLKTFKLGGIHPHDNKISRDVAIATFEVPETVVIPLSQHIGSPAAAAVKKGDAVKVGQVIGTATGFVSSNIHSSVSGTVTSTDSVPDAGGLRKAAITIKVEGDEWVESIDRSADIKRECSLTAAEIVKKVAEAGIVGMGGATFPTQVKLSIPSGKTAQCLIINGVECEPYLTADHRLMLEHGTEMLIGTEILMKAIGVKKAYIGIENNKPDAINHLQAIIAKEKFDGITVVPLKVQYPQGGEKQLINAVTGREVPSGGLPIEAGAVVQNVGTAYAVYEAIQKGKPLFERVVTVTGKNVASPANLLVRIGTPVSALITATGGMPEDCSKVVGGGPMMGRAMANIESPITKGSSGVLLFKDSEAKRRAPQVCISCSKCVNVCPMGLEPYLISKQSQLKMYAEAEADRITDCIECGSCSYTCPANLPLLDMIRLGKTEVMKIIRSRK